jgi:hypothetical protein
VLPQMLSERAAHLGFDGIAYTSTQVTKDYCGSEESFFTSRYRENLALFTSYSKTEDHDKYLLDKFDISSPIRFSDITPVGYTQFDDLKREAVRSSANCQSTRVAKTRIRIRASRSGHRPNMAYSAGDHAGGRLEIDADAAAICRKDQCRAVWNGKSCSRHRPRRS